MKSDQETDGKSCHGWTFKTGLIRMPLFCGGYYRAASLHLTACLTFLKFLIIKWTGNGFASAAASILRDSWRERAMSHEGGGDARWPQLLAI
jgi:hypothetical protein